MTNYDCPQCGVPLDTASMTEGKVPCPQCGNWFLLPSSPVVDAPAVPGHSPAAGSASFPSVHEQQPSVDFSQFDDEIKLAPPAETKSFVPAVDTGQIDTTSGEKSDVGPTKWLPIVAGGIVTAIVLLIGGVLYLVTKSEDPSKQQTAAASANQTDQAESADGDKPTQQDSSDSDGGVLDLSNLNALDTLDTVPETPADVAPRIEIGTNQFGWPQGITLVSIPGGQVGSLDGVMLTGLSETGLSNVSMTLPVPGGTHQVRTIVGGDFETKSSSGFAEYYENQKQKFSDQEGLDLKRLSNELVDSSGIFTEPVLPHLIGDAYWLQGQSDSAVRFWNAAIRVTPSFAPSHLNLAFSAIQNGRPDAARKHLYFASALNVQDAFGIARHITQLRRELPPTLESKYLFNEQDYLPTTNSDEKTQRVVDVLSTLTELAEAPEDKAACLNNIGVFFMHRRQSPDVAFSYFLQAQQELNVDDLAGGNDVARTILDNLVKSADAANFAEADLFRQIQSAQ